MPQQMPPQHRMPQMYMGHPSIALIPVMMQPPQPTPLPKRPASPENDEPKAKKAKGKGKMSDGNSGSSLRCHKAVIGLTGIFSEFETGIQ